MATTIRAQLRSAKPRVVKSRAVKRKTGKARLAKLKATGPRGVARRSPKIPADHVSTLDELARLDPLPPARPMPPELRRMLEPDGATAGFVESAAKPRLRASAVPVGRGAKSTVWKVEVAATGAVPASGRTGIVGSRFSATDLARADRRARAGAASHRPPWVTTAFLPRLTPRRRYHAAVPIARTRALDMAVATPPVMNTFDIIIEGYPFGWPWHCVGRVFGGLDTDFDRPTVSGTGVLVGRNVLITAAHIAVWGRGPGRWWMRFFPGWYDGPNPKLGSSFVEQFRGPGPQSHPNSNDFAVCKLYDPLGDALGYMGYQWSSDDDFYEDRRWLSVGYPSFQFGGQRPAFEFDIEIVDVDNNGRGRELEISLNDHLLNGGWSGGPLWGWFPGDDPRVIGVCSGWDSDGWDPYRSVFAGGGPMVDYIAAARRDWS